MIPGKAVHAVHGKRIIGIALPVRKNNLRLPARKIHLLLRPPRFSIPYAHHRYQRARKTIVELVVIPQDADNDPGGDRAETAQKNPPIPERYCRIFFLFTDIKASIKNNCLITKSRSAALCVLVCADVRGCALVCANNKNRHLDNEVPVMRP